MSTEYRRSRAPAILSVLLLAAIAAGATLYWKGKEENRELREQLAAAPTRPGTPPATNIAPSPTPAPTPEPAPTPTPTPEPTPAGDPCMTDFRAKYQGRSLSFCYPTAWGRSAARPTSVAASLRTGMEYIITFTGSAAMPIISYATANFALSGDMDVTPLPRTIDLQQSDDALRATFARYGRVDGFSRIVVGGRPAIRVQYTVTALDGTPDPTAILVYLVPNAFTIDGTSFGLLIQSNAMEVATMDRFVTTIRFR
ncbi:hypothetical protein HY632_00045 [Candidatus Uhrbacteria bacterium]|nr:hypothetical protein [Candidatus Uhrbacteria bacterium]